jgi:hypothetical protein
MAYQKKKITAEEVAQIRKASNINVLPKNLAKLPPAPSKLGKAASSIGKGMAATIPILGQTISQAAKDTIQQMGDEDFRTARMNQAIAQMDPAITQARFNQGRYGVTPQPNQNLQRANQALQDAMIDTPINLNSVGGKLMQGSIDDWQYATKDLSGGQRFLADTGRSILENVATLPLAAVNPSLPLAAMGARASASKAFDLSQQGVGAGEALSRGLVSGGIEAITERIPLENVLRLGKEGSKQVIKSLLKQSGMEATEESIAYVLNHMADKAYQDPTATFSLEELAMSAAGGALSGGVMGGGAMAFNRTANRTAQSKPLPQEPQQTQQIMAQPAIQQTEPIIKQPVDIQQATPLQLPPPKWFVNPDGVTTNDMTNLQQQNTRKPGLHIDKRTVQDVQSKNVNAFQYDNPQIKPFFQEQARYLLNDLESGVKGKRFYNPETETWTGQTRLNSEPIEKMLDSGLSYEQIKNGLTRIIEDAGKENTVIAKKVEFAIDEALSKGYKGLDGNIPMNEAYLIAKSEIPGAEGNAIFSEDEIKLIHEQQKAPDYKARYARQVVQQPDTPVSVPEPVIAPQPQQTAKPSLPRNERSKQANTKLEMNLQFFPGDRDMYQEYVDKYGAIPEGENPAREIQVPIQVEPHTKTRQFARTALEAKATPDAMVEDIKNEIVRRGFAYEPIKDSNAMDYAESTIKDKSFEGALKQWEAVANGTKVATKNDIVLGEMLYKEAANAGDTQLAMKLLAEIAAEGTRAGQNVQALRSLKKMTPEGQLYYIQKTVDNLNTDLAEKYGKKVEPIKINEKLAGELLKSTTTEEVNAKVEEIKQDIADQVPASWMDKWNNWRYLSMLGNPRTHIRNIVGNVVFVPARKLKNVVGVGLEKKLSQAERTKAILTKKDKALIDFAKADFEKNADYMTQSGKYNPANAIRENRKIFDNKVLEWIRKTNFDALEKEDIFFLSRAYVDSLAGWMKAQGMTADNINQWENSSALERGRNYAIQEALKATYRDASEIATWINGLSRKNAAANIFVEGVMPFKKTPINILKRGVEYSPAGLVKGVVDMQTKVKSGKMTATEAIDEIAAGLSGTAIMALGAWLSSMGLLTAGEEEEKRRQDFDELQGVQNYALRIPFTDTSYTIDWMAPVALPLFVGAEMFKMLKEENKTSTSTEILEAMGKITEPMFNLSMLQGVEGILSSVTYSKGQKGLAIMGSAASSYVSQAIPTLAGQVARTIDGTRRNAYYADKNVDLPSTTQITLNKAKAKLPIASKKLPAYVDQWGRKDIEDNIAIRAFENFLSPGYISKNNPTETDQKLRSLYDKTGESKVLPSSAPKYFNVDGKRVDLTAKQHEKYAVEKGKKSFEYAKTITSDRRFSQLPDSKKVEVISDAYEIANAIAKSKVTLYKPEGAAKKVLELERQGISISDFLITNELLKDVTGDKDWKGNTVQLSASKKKKAVIDEQNKNLGKDKLKLLYEAFNISEKVQ